MTEAAKEKKVKKMEGLQGRADAAANAVRDLIGDAVAAPADSPIRATRMGEDMDDCDVVDGFLMYHRSSQWMTPSLTLSVREDNVFVRLSCHSLTLRRDIILDV